MGGHGRDVLESGCDEAYSGLTISGISHNYVIVTTDNYYMGCNGSLVVAVFSPAQECRHRPSHT